MSFNPTIYALPSDDILQGSTVSGTAPLATYSLATLLGRNPAARVAFGAASATITFTLGSPAEGGVLIIPGSNLVGSVLTLTNAAGLSIAVPIPVLPTTRIPLTTALDFSAQANRTSDVWHLVITGNPANIVLGGAVAIFGPKRTLDPDFQFGFVLRRMRAAAETQNEYLTRYGQDYQTLLRSLDVTVRAASDKMGAFEQWHDASCVSANPSLLWPQRTGMDAFYGSWQIQSMNSGLRLESYDYAAKQVGDADFYDITLSFNELSKGKPF